MKNILNYEDFLTESFNDLLKLTEENKKLLLKYDKEFHKQAEIYEKEHVHFANIINQDSAIDGILYAVTTGDQNYKVDIEYEDSKFSVDEWCDAFIQNIQDIKLKIEGIDCCLTKYYSYRINKIVEQTMFLNQYSKDKTHKPQAVNYPTKELYDNAIEIIKQNKYVDVDKLASEDDDYKQTYSPQESKKILQDEIDRLGYDWKVVIDNNMVPRMSVRPYHEFRINGKNKFSKVDLESLKVHEIAVHVARKFYGLQTGLYLFLYGLKGNNIYDEGLAIYNSLNKVKKTKPNILFYVCIKIILLYELSKHSVIEAFDKVKKLTGVDDRVIALAIVRASRVFSYTDLYNSSTDEDYLDGYIRVKDMTEADRKKLLTLPIGPEQLFEMDTINKFLKINKFEPIK